MASANIWQINYSYTCEQKLLKYGRAVNICLSQFNHNISKRIKQKTRYKKNVQVDFVKIICFIIGRKRYNTTLSNN